MKDKDLILEMLESANRLLQAAKDVVDNSEQGTVKEDASFRQVEHPAPKKKRGRPPKKKPKPKPKDDFTVDKASTSRTPEFTHNKFEEMMSLDIDKPEGYDKIDDSGPRSPRARNDYSPVKMTCEECNKVFSVNPVFKKDNYVCDRCVGKKFGR